MSVHGKKNEVERKPSLENGAIRVEKQPSGINVEVHSSSTSKSWYDNY